MRGLHNNPYFKELVSHQRGLGGVTDTQCLLILLPVYCSTCSNTTTWRVYIHRPESLRRAENSPKKSPSWAKIKNLEERFASHSEAPASGNSPLCGREESGLIFKVRIDLDFYLKRENTN